jgi:hypothetical protein
MRHHSGMGRIISFGGLDLPRQLAGGLAVLSGEGR